MSDNSVQEHQGQEKKNFSLSTPWNISDNSVQERQGQEKKNVSL
jgi:hypothetical protein